MSIDFALCKPPPNGEIVSKRQPAVNFSPLLAAKRRLERCFAEEIAPKLRKPCGEAQDFGEIGRGAPRNTYQ